ncbi:MAG: hypothetical protein P1U69_01660 [Parvibaculaceae bacterium]|nr:hypothetical protein [Parvibaculaceae bacterium]|tara:strand:+ start:265 stop:483 length:219 start_codon:yes stop_codon:yes gene_type:complete
MKTSTGRNALPVRSATGTQRFGDVAVWALVIGKRINVLYDSTITGVKGTPARGLCFDCSDDELKAAVNFMVE